MNPWLQLPPASRTKDCEPVPCSAWLGRISRRAALKAIGLGVAGWVVGIEPRTQQRYYIAIDPCSDEGDKYCMAVFRVEEGGVVVLVSTEMRPNAEVSDADPSAGALDPKL